VGREHANAWATLAKHALAFYNKRGGILVFGLRNDYSFCGASTRLDAKLVNDQLRKVRIPLTTVPPFATLFDMSKAYRNNPQRCGSSDSAYSLMEFERRFPDDAACLENLVERLYPEGIFCPTCDKITKHHRDSKR